MKIDTLNYREDTGTKPTGIKVWEFLIARDRSYLTWACAFPMSFADAKRAVVLEAKSISGVTAIILS